MRKLAVALLPLVALLAACGSSSGPSDREAPTIRNLYPLLFKGALQVDGSILVAFSEDMNLPSLQTGVTLVDSTGAAASATVTAFGSSVSLKPTVPLKPMTTYTLVVSRSVKDLAGNPLAAESRTTYTTEAAPYPITLNYFTANSFGTAAITANFTYRGMEEAGSIWLRASCVEDGYSNLNTSLATSATPSRWAPGQTQNIVLRYSSGFSYFTGNTVRCRFSSDDSSNTRRVIVQQP